MDDTKLEQIKKILLDADLMNLIDRNACNFDEYDSEALLIYESINRYDYAEKIKYVIWDIFYLSFCTGGTLDKDSSEIRRNSWRMERSEAINEIGTVDKYADVAFKIKKVIGS
jgi:hypothetical protein